MLCQSSTRSKAEAVAWLNSGTFSKMYIENQEARAGPMRFKMFCLPRKEASVEWWAEKKKVI